MTQSGHSLCRSPNAAIRALIDHITLTPEDGKLRIDLYGELATILQFAAGKEKPAAEVHDGLAQLKLVAGARNHLYRKVVIWRRTAA